MMKELAKGKALQSIYTNECQRHIGLIRINVQEVEDDFCRWRCTSGFEHCKGFVSMNMLARGRAQQRIYEDEGARQGRSSADDSY